MRSELVNLTYEIELQPGEVFSLPGELLDHIGPGRWIISIQPVGVATQISPIRDHSAFLSSYAPEDEGLYDDYPPR